MCWLTALYSSLLDIFNKSLCWRKYLVSAEQGVVVGGAKKALCEFCKYAMGCKGVSEV